MRVQMTLRTMNPSPLNELLASSHPAAIPALAMLSGEPEHTWTVLGFPAPTEELAPPVPGRKELEPRAEELIAWAATAAGSPNHWRRTDARRVLSIFSDAASTASSAIVEAVEWMRRHQRMELGSSLRLLARAPHDDVLRLLRELLSENDWRVQADAIAVVVELGLTEELAESLEHLAQTHWSEGLRSLAQSAQRGVLLERVPPHSKCWVPRVCEHSGDASRRYLECHAPTSWVVEHEGKPARRRLEPIAPRVPIDAPDICIVDPFADSDNTQWLDLFDRPHTVVPWSTGWLVSADRGEFGAVLAWVRPDGGYDILLEDNVSAVVRTRFGWVALAGLNHITSWGRLYQVDDTTQPPKVEFFVELPSAPIGYWIEADGRLRVATRFGVYDVEADGHLILVGCVDVEGEPRSPP